MTERTPRASDLLESMGRMVVPVADESVEEREQVIEAVNRRLDSARFEQRKRVQKRWSLLAVAAVLCLSSGFAFAHYGLRARAPRETPAASVIPNTPPALMPVTSIAEPAASQIPRPIAAAPVTSPSASSSLHKPVTSASANVSKVQAGAAPSDSASTLAQENDLYAAASSAARSGNDVLAVSDLSSLLSRYPASPLAQNARVDRFRALARLGRKQEAVAQARRYLADYPNGFARDEAKALVLSSLANP